MAWHFCHVCTGPTSTKASPMYLWCDWTVRIALAPSHASLELGGGANTPGHQVQSGNARLRRRLMQPKACDQPGGGDLLAAGECRQKLANVKANRASQRPGPIQTTGLDPSTNSTTLLQKSPASAENTEVLVHFHLSPSERNLCVRIAYSLVLRYGFNSRSAQRDM